MKYFKLIAGLLFLGMLAACSRVPAGNVGVKVYLLGTEKGVDTEVLTPGRYWIGFNEELYLFPTFTQNTTWARNGDSAGESISFQSIEGMKVNAEVGISYSIDPTKVSAIFQKYRQGIDEITDKYIRNMVRDALVIEGGRLRIDSIYGSGKEDLIRSVEKRVRNQVEEIGIRVERIYWAGDFRLPSEVVALINAKINAGQLTQQRQQEIEQTKAEAQKKIEEARGVSESTKLQADAKAYQITQEAKAQAEANRILAQSLTPELVRYKQIERWDGSLPRISSEGTGLMLQLPAEK